ncbi:MAG: right-handed parallel beta-helix repeat-containing protein [Planctomycetes bacterium]|nr:right-handed parallel beta-helix repeat-containing protein [Planctomycetota bacterium]
MKAAVLLTLPLLSMSLPAPAGEIALDQDDVVVTTDVRVRPGTYRVTDDEGDGVLIVRGEGVTVDLTGVTLLGCEEGAPADGYRGIGIHVDGARGVAIRGGRVSGFKVGIYAREADRLRVEGVEATRNFRQHLKSTPEREDGADWLWPHNNDDNEWMKNYGAGIYLDRCPGAVVAACRGRNQQNGVILARSDGCAVYDNDFSYHSGWGVALWRSSRNKIAHNRLDYCVRGYSHGVYYRGQDSAAILVFEQCRENVFAANSATHSGDGFFLYAGHETTQRTGGGGSNDNLVHGNDFSHAVANGIEATFSSGNRFEANILDECDYGVWAGYSRDTVIAGNRISRSQTAGVAIEHGHDNRIEGNTFEGDRTGVSLWWDDDPDLLAGPFGKKQDTDSDRNTIVANRFTGAEVGVRLARSSGTLVDSNEFHSVRTALHFRGPAGTIGLVGNRLEDVERPVDSDSPSVAFRERPEGDRPLVYLPDEPPEVPGTLDPFLPAGARRGRETMMVDEWGPCDPSETRLFPSRIEGGAEARCHLIGPGGTFEASCEGASVEPASGTIPTTLAVRAPGPGGHEFRLTVHVGGQELVATGTLFAARWNVRYHLWPDEGPRRPPADWGKVEAGEPLVRVEADELDFVWGGGGPAPGVPADHFATVAETEVELAAGRYSLRTVSDDGVRVLVDGKMVLENWTWHGPTENSVEIDLDAGKHKVRIEHFEIDGHAELRFRISPAGGR